MTQEKDMAITETGSVTMPTENGAQPQAQVYTVRHNGTAHDLTMDQLLVCAQKGLDYDRVRAQRDQLRQAEAQDGYRSFFAAHPEITGADQIPQEVIHQVAQGKDLTTAYLMYENNRLQEEVASLKNAAKPAPAPMMQEGSAVSDDFLTGLFGR